MSLIFAVPSKPSFANTVHYRWNIQLLESERIIVLLNSDLEIMAKFYIFLILQNDRKLMWQKQQQVRSHMACAPFLILVEWKIWKWRTRVCWTKITVIYDLRKVYQTKYIQPWSESFKSVQVWVIEKSYNCALAHCSCKNTAENFDRHVTDVQPVTVKIIFHRLRTLSAFPYPCCGCFGIRSSWMRRSGCSLVSESGTENILASDIFRISEATLVVLRGW